MGGAAAGRRTARRPRACTARRETSGSRSPAYSASSATMSGAVASLARRARMPTFSYLTKEGSL